MVVGVLALGIKARSNLPSGLQGEIFLSSYKEVRVETES